MGKYILQVIAFLLDFLKALWMYNMSLWPSCTRWAYKINGLIFFIGPLFCAYCLHHVEVFWGILSFFSINTFTLDNLIQSHSFKYNVYAMIPKYTSPALSPPFKSTCKYGTGHVTSLLWYKHRSLKLHSQNRIFNSPLPSAN